MQNDISLYKILNKRLTGDVLKIFFGMLTHDKPVMVLEMTDIVAFIDSANHEEGNHLLLQITKAGSYGTDMAMRLKKPEIIEYEEVFLFTDLNLTKTTFRALAKSIKWRKFDNKVYGDINY